MVNEETFEPSIRDLCEIRGWELIDLGRQLNPPVSRAHISRLSRGDRTLTPAYAGQMAELLQVSVDRIKLAVQEGARRQKRRQEYLQQAALVAVASEPPKRPRRQRSA